MKNWKYHVSTPLKCNVSEPVTALKNVTLICTSMPLIHNKNCRTSSPAFYYTTNCFSFPVLQQFDDTSFSCCIIGYISEAIALLTWFFILTKGLSKVPRHSKPRGTPKEPLLWFRTVPGQEVPALAPLQRTPVVRTGRWYVLTLYFIQDNIVYCTNRNTMDPWLFIRQETGSARLLTRITRYGTVVWKHYQADINLRPPKTFDVASRWKTYNHAMWCYQQCGHDFSQTFFKSHSYHNQGAHKRLKVVS